MMTNVSTGGSFGMTAIANTAEEADELYKRTQQIFDDEARAALNG